MDEDRRQSRWILAAIAFVVLAAVGLGLYGRAEDRAALETVLEELRRKGQPVTPADLRPSAEGMGENAAERYQDGFAALADLTDEDKHLLGSFDGRWPEDRSEEEVARVEELVASHGEALEALEEGT